MKPAIFRSWLACLILLSGCSAVLVKPAPVADDSAAKVFAPAPGRALLYIYRGSSLGGDYATDVRANGKSVAKNAYKRFVVLSFAPGHYRVETRALLYSDKHPLELDARANEVLFFEEIWDFTQGFSLQERNSESAKAVVGELKLASRVDVLPP